MSKFLDKEDLAQMNQAYFESLDHGTLVKVAGRLLETAIEFLERLQKDSTNSSLPPSSNNPFRKKGGKTAKEEASADASDDAAENQPHAESELSDDQTSSENSNQECANASSPAEPATGIPTNADTSAPNEDPSAPASPEPPKPVKRPPGKQLGAPDFSRSIPLVAELIIPHYPEHCAACSAPLQIAEDAKPHKGFYVLDLEKNDAGFRVVCSLHHYYAAVCACGHVTVERPGKGYLSESDGRKKNLQLQEEVLVGPMLATFIASLAVRFRLSRRRIQEFLMDWANTSLSIGTIDRCIREAGIACAPVVKELIEKLQESEIIHADETPWYEGKIMLWLWVVISRDAGIVVYFIGARTRETFLAVVTEAFLGWLITDGYGVYRDFEQRQRCLAHLIRKALALVGGVDEKASHFGEWLLRELRGLIAAVADFGEDSAGICRPMIARLKRACLLACDGPTAKMRALAREILNDWEAVVAFVKNPALPPTNNEAERALRHAVISRLISQGTRTPEGSVAYAALLSLIETCRLRQANPWDYLAQVIANGRKGLPHPLLPTLPTPTH
jgi:IS1 family transposase